MALKNPIRGSLHHPFLHANPYKHKKPNPVMESGSYRERLVVRL